MAEKVGVKTGQTTKAGRPVYKTPEGELVSEKSVTIPMGGKFINIPSIHDGVMYSEDELIDMLKNNKIEATSVHDSMEEAIEAAKSRSPKLLSQGGSMNSQMEMFEVGGMLDEGGSVDPVSGNDVPSGSTQEEVRDDINAKLSEGEFVLPADVVRYIGLENIMKMRDMAKEGLAKMEAMGQMGNSEEATISDTTDFDDEINQMIDEMDDDVPEFNVGGLAGQQQQQQNQQGFAPTTVGFLPPGVTAPAAPTGELPQAPVITPGSGGGIPTYETKQYIGPNGEIRTFTFINGKPFPDIPEGFKEYTPAEVPSTQTAVPTTQVSGGQSDGDGRDNDDDNNVSVDTTLGMASAFGNINTTGKVGTAVDEYNSRMKKVGLAAVAAVASGNVPGLFVAAYKGYQAGQDLKKTAQSTFAKANPTLAAVLESTEDNIDVGMTQAEFSNSITSGLEGGLSAGLSAALASSGVKMSINENGGIDFSGGEKSAEKAVEGLYGSSLAQTNPTAYRDMIEEAAFLDATGQGIMSDSPKSNRNFSTEVIKPSTRVTSSTPTERAMGLTRDNLNQRIQDALAESTDIEAQTEKMLETQKEVQALREAEAKRIAALNAREEALREAEREAQRQRNAEIARENARKVRESDGGGGGGGGGGPSDSFGGGRDADGWGE